LAVIILEVVSLYWSAINSINRKIEIIKSDQHYGDPIAKNLIPKEYTNNDIANLFRVELSNSWRLLYTINKGDNEGRL
jgi:hypothetical protein